MIFYLFFLTDLNFISVSRYRRSTGGLKPSNWFKYCRSHPFEIGPAHNINFLLGSAVTIATALRYLCTPNNSVPYRKHVKHSTELPLQSTQSCLPQTASSLPLSQLISPTEVFNLMLHLTSKCERSVEQRLIK